MTDPSVLSEKQMKKAITIVFVALFLSAAISAQTTEFTFQGRLLDNTLPATGTYDMQFRLWTSDTGGGGGGFGVETRPNVAVSQGIFTVVLDFGNLFTGPERWIEISIRPAGSSEQYLTLAGRQRITSTPYSIKSLNSDTATTATNSSQLGGVAASEYVVTTDPRMSDERQPAPFSGNYIQNTPSQQAASNFFISGLGRANILSANTQFNLGTNRILAAPGSFNFFAGIGTGASITTGISNTLVGGQAGDSLSQGGNNSFFGAQAGRSTTSANGNSFFGASAGRLNTSGGLNSFFGLNSGEQTTIGADNSFFGAFSGSGNSNGSGNSFFGSGSGSSNSSGNSNSFFGFSAGAANTEGQGNSFYGAQSGLVNSTGSTNSFFGSGSGQANTTGSSNTFVGVESGFSNTLGASNVFVGTSAGRANAAGARNAIVGSFAGSLATGDDNAFFGGSAGRNTIGGSGNSMFGGFAGEGNVGGTFNSALGFSSRFASPSLTNSTVIGSRAQVSTSNSIVLGSINGVNGATADTNVGIGTTAPTQRLHVVGNGLVSGDLTVGGTLNANLSISASNITSGTLPMVRGGTGVNISGPAGTFLRSNGANWVLSGIQASDLPTGSNNYIRNQTSQQVANFNIFGGTGTASIFNAISQFNIGGNRVLAVVEAGPSSVGGSLFAGIDSGTSVTTGHSNSFFGERAGAANTNGSNNTFVGRRAGSDTISGSGNSFFGVNAGTSNSAGAENTAIGSRAGFSNAGNRNTFLGYQAGDSNTVGSDNTIIGYNADIIPISFGGMTFNPLFATAIGSGSTNGESSSIQLGRTNGFDRVKVSGRLFLGTLSEAGATALCQNAQNEIASCSSSMRYKSNVLNYEQSRGVLDRLRPVSFTWNGSNLADLGLVAEEVAEIEPLLVTYNDKGEVEGVKYDRIGVVLVNVVKEQQSRISAQQRQIEELKAVVCGLKPDAAVCTKEN